MRYTIACAAVLASAGGAAGEISPLAPDVSHSSVSGGGGEFAATGEPAGSTFPAPSPIFEAPPPGEGKPDQAPVRFDLSDGIDLPSVSLAVDMDLQAAAAPAPAARFAAPPSADGSSLLRKGETLLVTAPSGPFASIEHSGWQARRPVPVRVVRLELRAEEGTARGYPMLIPAPASGFLSVMSAFALARRRR